MPAPRFSPTIALLTLARAAEVDVARILEPHGLSVRKLAILTRLAAVPGASPADLARTVGISADEAGPILRAMTATDLIRRTRDGQLAVSEPGAVALQRVEAALADLDARLFADRDALAGELYDVTGTDAAEPRD
jgi:DNA-binding MarR family transcriptional regulator